MKNRVLQERLKLWQNKYPSLFKAELKNGNRNPFFEIISKIILRADNTPEVSWLEKEVLEAFVDELVTSFVNLAIGGLKSAELMQNAGLTKPVFDLIKAHRDRMIDAEISGNVEINIDGIRDFITKDEIIRHSVRTGKIILKREDVISLQKDLIAFKMGLYKDIAVSCETHNYSNKKSRNSESTKQITTLFEAFSSPSKYSFIMNLLVTNKYCNTGNYIWIDNKGSAKGTIVYLLNFLHKQGYFKENTMLKKNEIVLIAKNTFGVDISESTAKQSKVEDTNLSKLIPLASTIQ